jgi:MFS family permease
MDQAGAIIGPLAAFALFPLVGFMGIFYLSLVLAAIAVIILIFFVKEKFAPVQVKKSIAGSIQAVLAEKRFVALLAIMGTYVFCRRIQLCIRSDKGIGSWNF